MKKLIYAIVGIICSSLGILGVWLPGLPTTVFILIALWAFSNSNEQLHRWLLKTPLLGAAVVEAQRYQKERTIDARVKVIAQASAWISFAVVTLTLRSVGASLIVGICAIACSVFMALTPTRQFGSETVESDQ